MVVPKFKLFYESAASDAYEQAIALNLRNNGVDAIRPRVGTDYSDIKINFNNSEAWLEVKMNHTDNFANPRFFFNGKNWDTTYSTPIATIGVDILNKDNQSKKFIKELRDYTKNNLVTIPTTQSGLKNDPNAVPLLTLQQFCQSRPGSQYIMKSSNINVGDLITAHCVEGKTESAFYLQTGDDFYLLSNQNPLKLPTDIPVFGGTGTFNVRASIRSAFYEIQLEVKVTNMTDSPYSIKPGTLKLNPFSKIKKIKKR